jgi:hypothetical protein
MASDITEDLELYFPNALFDEALSVSKMKRLNLRPGVQFYRLTKAFKYNSPSVGTIVVPRNFLTDYASIPRLAQAVIDDDDPAILYPAIIHDWGYSMKGNMWMGSKPAVTKKQVDGIFLEAMKLTGASYWKRTVVYQAVNWFGKSSWEGPGDPVIVNDQNGY